MTYSEAVKYLGVRQGQIKPSDFGFISPSAELLLNRMRTKITKQNNDQLLETHQLKGRSDLEVYVYENSNSGTKFPQIDSYLHGSSYND